MTSTYTFYIITPSFNQARFLSQTIESVLSQHGNFSVQYCVIDGGSTDGTKKVLKKLPKNVHWISEKDEGQTDAINKGIRYFKTLKCIDPDKVLFAYINSDDFYLPGVFQRVAAYFEGDPTCQWLVGDAVIVDSDNQEIQGMVRRYKQWWRMIISKFVLTVLNPLPQPSTFIRWSAVKKVGVFNADLRYVMDYEYWLRLYASGYTPTVDKSTFSAFRIHGQSKGGSQYKEQFAEELSIAKRFATNPLAIWLHQLHNLLIIGIYRLIK